MDYEKMSEEEKKQMDQYFNQRGSFFIKRKYEMPLVMLLTIIIVFIPCYSLSNNFEKWKTTEKENKYQSCLKEVKDVHICNWFVYKKDN